MSKEGNWNIIIRIFTKYHATTFPIASNAMTMFAKVAVHLLDRHDTALMYLSTGNEPLLPTIMKVHDAAQPNALNSINVTKINGTYILLNKAF